LTYRLAFHPDALAEWKALDGSALGPLKKLLAKRLENPRVPGGALRGPLEGYYKIKLLKQGVRLVYTIDEQQGRVVVVAVGRREENEVYAAAKGRVSTSELVRAIFGNKV
jgi:mRNA interferase RelE/StbE